MNHIYFCCCFTDKSRFVRSSHIKRTSDDLNEKKKRMLTNRTGKKSSSNHNNNKKKNTELGKQDFVSLITPFEMKDLAEVCGFFFLVQRKINISSLSCQVTLHTG